MTTNTRPESALDGLLTCAECGGPMACTEGPEPRYACQPTPANGRNRCRTPELHTGQADDLIIGAVLQAILTERNITTALAAANGLQPDDDAPGYRFTREEIQQLKGHPELFFQAVGGAVAARDFLCGFITEIRVHPGKSVIHYAIPLPAESPLAGMRQQKIRIPKEALA